MLFTISLISILLSPSELEDDLEIMSLKSVSLMVSIDLVLSRNGR